MEHEFWHKCWERNTIGFHQHDIHPFLLSDINAMVSATAQTVFVPLCGKSLDMLWWAERCQVIGSELSEIACNDFFIDNNIPLTKGEQGEFTLYQYQNLALYQGDFFKLEPSLLPPLSYIYDRAALIAMPPQMRQQYINHLQRFIGESTALLLISVEFPESELAGPPFPVAKPEIVELFSDYQVEEVAQLALSDKQFAQRSLPVSNLVERLYRITKL